jgi:hypothetical protein
VHLWRRVKSFLQTVPARIDGSHVDVGSERIELLHSTAKPAERFTDEHRSLIRKRMAVRAWMRSKGIDYPKPLIEEQPDGFQPIKHAPDAM